MFGEPLVDVANTGLVAVLVGIIEFLGESLGIDEADLGVLDSEMFFGEGAYGQESLA